jgi:hypothetical protein
VTDQSTVQQPEPIWSDELNAYVQPLPGFDPLVDPLMDTGEFQQAWNGPGRRPQGSTRQQPIRQATSAPVQQPEFSEAVPESWAKRTIAQANPVNKLPVRTEVVKTTMLPELPLKKTAAIIGTSILMSFAGGIYIGNAAAADQHASSTAITQPAPGAAEGNATAPN